MGNSKTSVKQVQALIEQIKNEIPSRRFFELGDDPTILKNIKQNIDNLRQELERLKGSFNSEFLKEINPYFSVIRIIRKLEKFITEVEQKSKGSIENSNTLRMLLDELNRAVQEMVAKLDNNDLLLNTSNPKKNSVSKSQERALKYLQSVFISYAWGDEREKIVHEIDKSLKKRGIEIFLDKRDLEYKGSISQFMQRIGRGDCVIVVISDKYLRSPNCMFELVEVADNNHFQERVFPVIWKDANIYDPVKRIEYIKYWEQKRAELANAIKELDPANLQGLREEMDLYDSIRDKISGLTYILKDMNALTPEMHQESNFSHLYSAIEKKLGSFSNY